ncbi:MAG: Fic family protein [Microbacteriaceae bacterium]|nr:MAG: Fic family protein [Microbacteriaceae bacterium]
MMKNIEFPNVRVESELMSCVFRLERMRGELVIGTTPPAVFFELHSLFQFLSSVISARIEGNHTTLLDALTGVEAAERQSVGDQMREILNVTAAMDWIDEVIADTPITHTFIRHLHEVVVQDLVREGDTAPGRYRTADVTISGAQHKPPAGFSVQGDMDLLLDFIKRDVQPQFQLIHVALAHHRFVWIHPFGNGNGRVSRLLSYAMLAKHGFVSPIGLRAVNPTSVFGVAREEYCSRLAAADDLSDAGTISWCEFFLNGLLLDLDRAHKLQDIAFVRDRLIAPALDRFVASGRITAIDRDVLAFVFERVEIRAGELSGILPGSPSVRSQALRPLIERGLLAPRKEGGRVYHLAFAPNEFTPFVVNQLDALGFLPPLLKDEH